MTTWVLEMFLSILRTFLLKSTKAAQFAKYLLRARDYLLMLFPLSTYPPFETNDSFIGAVTSTQVPIEAVQKASKEFGFNLPFIKGY